MAFSWLYRTRKIKNAFAAREKRKIKSHPCCQYRVLAGNIDWLFSFNFLVSSLFFVVSFILRRCRRRRYHENKLPNYYIAREMEEENCEGSIVSLRWWQFIISHKILRFKRNYLRGLDAFWKISFALNQSKEI